MEQALCLENPQNPWYTQYSVLKYESRGTPSNQVREYLEVPGAVMDRVPCVNCLYAWRLSALLNKAVAESLGFEGEGSESPDPHLACTHQRP